MTLVARHGEIVHWDARGWRVRDQDPLEPDDIFRIYSMTKPVTSVAAMMLVEDGLLSLDDELGSLIADFADVRVYEDGGTRPPGRPILVRDLLSHTSGLTYGFFGDSPVDSMYNRALNALSTSVGNDEDAAVALEKRVATIASLPLVDDPGARWIYIEPLGMDDTGFMCLPTRWTVWRRCTGAPATA